MNRGTFAVLYMLVSSIVNIIYSLVVCAVVVVLSMLMMKYVFHARAELFMPALSGFFILGLVISFITYSKISMKVIKKYRLDERFSGRRPSGKKGTPSLKKTVMPSSVTEDEEDEKWRE